jgi:hypothetical protein
MSDIKLKVTPQFPVTVLEGGGVRLDKATGKWSFSLDYRGYSETDHGALTDQSGAGLSDVIGDGLIDSNAGKFIPTDRIPLTDQRGITLSDGVGGILTDNNKYLPTDRILIFDTSNQSYFLAAFPFGVTSIATTPDPLVTFTTAPIGTLVGTLSIVNPPTNSNPNYTFSLISNPGGKYKIVGNQLQVAAALTHGTDTITIQADNGVGSIVTLTTTVLVRDLTAYVPTYYIYGF